MTFQISDLKKKKKKNGRTANNDGDDHLEKSPGRRRDYQPSHSSFFGTINVKN